jgi:pimeloyl-ACP methyl ester carboxylesterase
VPKVEVNDIEMYYEAQGDGDPLLLVAGIGQDHNTWGFMAPGLSSRFRLIMPDNRGVGQTDMPDMAYTVERMASDMLGLLDELEIQSAHVVGHSLGAAIAFEMGRGHPDRVRKVVMMSGLYPGPQVVMPSAEAMALLTDRSGEPQDLVERGVRVATAPGFKERRPELFEMLVQAGLNRTQPPKIYERQSAAGGLYLQADHLTEGFEPPLLLIYGEHDAVAPPANGERIQEKLPQADLTLIPEAGHFLHVEQPAAVNRAIIEFLEV